MDQNSSKFLAYFVDVEEWLKHETGLSEKDEFGKVLHESSRRGLISRHQHTDLQRLSHLRNFIVHHHNDAAPLASPTENSLSKIARLSELIMNPPKLYSLAEKDVAFGHPDDPLGKCIRVMHDRLFSQLPIHDGRVFVGLLTADTISRWLASVFPGDGEGIVEEQTVREVMSHQDDTQNHVFVARNLTVAEALRKFSTYQQRGRRLEAVLMTQNGKPDESLLGIITIYDIPRLSQALHG